MEVIIKARNIAIKALDKIIRKNEYSNYVIAESIENVDELDKSLFRKIVYGVVENQIYIDYIISNLVDKPINKLDKDIFNILRIAIYELTFLNTKEYAVINEAVNNSKKINYRLKGFVNAVLRNFLRSKEEYLKVNTDSNIDYLSIRYSVNKDLILYLKEYYENYEDIVIDFNNSPHLNIRVNTILISKEDLIEKLEYKGLIIKNSSISNDSLIIENPNSITELEEFNKGFFTIQDQSSVLVSEILNPTKNSKVLDLCAAPGSKSTHLMQIMKNEGILVSNDISFDKLTKIKENFDRMNLKLPQITNYNASILVDEFIDEFDYILVDAPCSGLGVVKRKPEIKLQRRLEDIKSLSELQYEILENSYKYLKKGGYIVYSTCTLGDLENKNVVNNFLKNHKDLKLEKIDNKDYIEILPTKYNDGFFISKIYKNA